MINPWGGLASFVATEDATPTADECGEESRSLRDRELLVLRDRAELPAIPGSVPEKVELIQDTRMPIQPYRGRGTMRKDMKTHS